MHDDPTFRLVLIAGSLCVMPFALYHLGLLVLRTRREEELLLERFGADYAEYQQRTGRFWPRLTKS